MSDLARIHAHLNPGNTLEFNDASTHERVFALAPIFYDDDFVAAGRLVFPTSATQGVDWIKKIVGAGPPTVAGVANAAGGQMACTLTATSEKQDAVLYWADQLGIDATKGLVFEARVKLSVLPSAASVQTVWGMAGPWIDGPDNNTFYLEFGATANGAILLRSQDGVTQNSIASGVTVLTTDFHIYRIDATDVTDVKFFIDGVQVSTTGAIKFAATGTNSVLQPYLAAYKPSGTGVATLTADYVRAFVNQRNP